MPHFIEHGANIALENWQYQKPHEMVTERDKVSSTQAFLNLCLETYQEKCLRTRSLFGNVNRYCRSYYRSIYDIADRSSSACLSTTRSIRCWTTCSRTETARFRSRTSNGQWGWSLSLQSM